MREKSHKRIFKYVALIEYVLYSYEYKSMCTFESSQKCARAGYPTIRSGKSRHTWYAKSNSSVFKMASSSNDNIASVSIKGCGWNLCDMLGLEGYRVTRLMAIIPSFSYSNELIIYLSSLTIPGIICKDTCPVLGQRFFDGIGRSDDHNIKILSINWLLIIFLTSLNSADCCVNCEPICTNITAVKLSPGS